MTLLEKMICTAYTGINFCGVEDEWDEFEKYIESVMGRPVQTIEMINEGFWEKIHDLTKESFGRMLRGCYDDRPEWIPVEDELPVSCVQVLVTVENDNDCADHSAPTEYSVKIADYGNAGDGDGHWYIELAETSDRVTAWMPMPKFYRYDEIVEEEEE